MTISIHIDGAARPNPGKGGMGVVISGEGYDYTISEPIEGKVSNNSAEYKALLRALFELIANELADRKITIYSDSMLVVNQMNGDWDAERGSYLSDYARAISLIKDFSDLTFCWIERGDNAKANMLASKAVRA